MNTLSKLGVDHDKPVKEWRDILSNFMSENEEVCIIFDNVHACNKSCLP